MTTFTVEINDAPPFFWTVRAESPVRRLFRSCDTFPTRTTALSDFQNTCLMLGWNNEVTEVML